MSIETNKQEYINNLDDIVSEIEAGHLSVFIGAGVSTSSGFVDWNGLMNPIIKQLGVNPNIDLALVAQFYENKYHRHNISKLIYNEFNKPAKNNKVLNLLGNMPISSYWTTNYDSLIEDTLSSFPISKTVDVMLNKNDFKYHKPNCDVTVYKMHGDKNSPDEAVITKNDYETYDVKREVFTKALSVELITNTFLFIGFSFSDPNLERILNIVKHTFDPNREKKHYCFMRKVQEEDYKNIQNKDTYVQDANYQSLRVEEMRRYGIETILLDDFTQIQSCLSYIQSMLNHKRVFISGSLQGDQKRPIEITANSKQAVFIQYLAERLTSNGYKIITGFGQNIGNYLLIGSCFNKEFSEIRNLHNFIEIYPLITKAEDPSALREHLVSGCGNMITIFGKTDPSKKHLNEFENDGVNLEYECAKKYGLTILPVGCTGKTSNILWANEEKTHPYLNTSVEEAWNNLKYKNYEKDKEQIVDSLICLMEYNYTKKQETMKMNLRNELIGSIEHSDDVQKIFISFHYNTAHQHADALRQFVNGTNRYTATEEEQIQNRSSAEAIKNWIKEKMSNTIATILIYDETIFNSEFVKYEIEQSIKRANKLIILSLVDDLTIAKNRIKKSGVLSNKSFYIYRFSEISSSCDILKIFKEIQI